MMYQKLAHFYDALVKDDESTKSWVDFIQHHIKGKRIMEVACGSGEITIALAKKGYQVDASDLSHEMIEEAKKKANSDKVHWKVMDMRNLKSETQYDGILCLCDSFNYILNLDEVKSMFQQVYESLYDDGIFIMDMHSKDRLEEFQEEFFEDGLIDGCGYQWTIDTIEDKIYQNFAFYDKDGKATLEQHIQRVYPPDLIKQLLQKCGFDVQLYTDFIHEGICEGEKYFYVARKRGNS